MGKTSSRPSAKPPDGSRIGVYPALVLLLTIPLSSLISTTFPAAEVISLATGGVVLGVGGPYFAWSRLAVLTATVLVFYEIGGRIDFARRYRLLAGLSFGGAILGNLPGFYYFSTASATVSWQRGLGYVSSLGLPVQTSLLNLFTAGLAAFMIPIAGLSLAYFRAGPGRWPESANEAGTRRSPSWVLFVACFAMVSLALPAASFAFTLLPHGPSPVIGISGVWSELISGYLSILLYPTLFLLGFYLIGRKIRLNGLIEFARLVFAAAVLGALAGLLLSLYIADPPGLYRVFLLSNLPTLMSDLAVDGVIALVLGFGAASLGLIQRSYHEDLSGHRFQES